MSNFACEKCGAVCIDTRIGYVTGCEHYPITCRCDSQITKCMACTIQERINNGEPVQDVIEDYGFSRPGKGD